MYKNYSESTPLPTPIFLSTASIAMSHPVVVSHASKINTTVVVLAVDIFDYAKPLPSFLILWEREMSEWVSWECCWCKLVRLALLWRRIAKNLNPALFTQTQVNNLICTHTFALPFLCRHRPFLPANSILSGSHVNTLPSSSFRFSENVIHYNFTSENGATAHYNFDPNSCHLIGVFLQTFLSKNVLQWIDWFRRHHAAKCRHCRGANTVAHLQPQSWPKGEDQLFNDQLH